LLGAAWPAGFSRTALANLIERLPGLLGCPVVARRRGAALSRVNEVLDTRPVISWINLVEVYYRIERDHGRETADEILRSLRASLRPELPGTVRVIHATRLKAHAPIAPSDCFAAETAAAHGLTLLTGDPELLGLADPPCVLEESRAS
jgi:predicted nucleic acid-binding protein